MQYLGGKSRISKQIGGIIDEVSRWQIKNFNTNQCNNNFNAERGGGNKMN